MGGVKMKIWKSAFLALTLVGMLIAAASAGAQDVQRGEIRGFVYDTSHAIVPNAKVTIFNPSTGYKREFTTDAAGLYDFAQLMPGVYQITGEAPGLSSITITDIVVEVAASLSLDVTLPVKGQTATVTVSAAATGPIDTSTAGINQVINQKNLEDLPLSGRDYRDLAVLSSSAQVVPGLRGGIRLGGQQSDYLGIVVDGQDSFNNFFGEIIGSLETKNFTIPMDAVQEFQVVTNGFAPEFGRAAGGFVNVVTKSGTNQLHGEAHEYYRGSSLTENDALGEAPNISDQHQFGGSVGFPIHKDRQFLFVATDVQREHGPLVTQFCSPGPGQALCESTLNATTGPVFANCTGPASSGGNCNPGNGTTIPAQVPFPTPAILAVSPLPAGCGGPAKITPGVTTVLQDCYGESSLGGFQGSSTQYQRLFTILGHYDYQFTPANHFSLRSYFTRNHTDGFSGIGQNEINMAFDGTENFINKGGSVVASLNTVLGRKVNEIRVSFQDEVRERHPNNTSPLLTIADSVGSGLAVGSLLNYGIGQRYFLPINNQDAKFEAADNFDYVFGKHDIKFGGDSVTFQDRKDSFVGWSAGEYDFFSLASFQQAAPGLLSQGVALNGLPLSLLGPATTTRPANQTDLGLYWQDKWQLTPNLTLTYGLRWDATWEPQPQTPLLGSTVLVGVGAGTHESAVPQVVPADYSQWGPRIGLAWTARKGDHPTVVRGAWGYYYALPITLFLPTSGAGNLTHCVASCVTPAAGFPYLNPDSTTLSASALLCSTNPLLPPPTVYGCPPPSPNGGYVDPKFENPRISNFTVGVEQALARNLTLTITYAFVHSTHLRTGGYDSEEAWQRNYVVDGTDQFGRSILDGMYSYVGGVVQNGGVPIGTTHLDPTIGNSTNETASFSRGNYHSVVVNLTKRFSNHFQVFANYMWSQNKDNAASERDTDSYFGASDPININIDYGRNGLDIKHQFKAAGVYELPWGFAVSSTVIAHTGVPFPLYTAQDINGDGVTDLSYNNDRPTFTKSNGQTVLMGRYPFNQPGFAQWDARLQKDFAFRERYHLVASGDFFNLTNRGNVYSSPLITTDSIVSVPGCVPRPAPVVAAGFTGVTNGPMGLICQPFTAATLPKVGVNGFRGINEIAPGSTPFAFQAGVKFIF
jgi:Carboxypeptidase regulatory-like domain/TonB dependent receptor